MPILEVNNIKKTFDKTEILKGITAQSVEALDNIPSIDVDSFSP